MADGDQTIVLVSRTVEAAKRLSPIETHGKVWEFVIAATFDADDTVAVLFRTPFNGIVKHISVDLPLTTTTGTTSQILIKDNGGIVVFDSQEIAENNTHNFVVDVPLSGTITISVEPSAASGDAVTISTITLRGI